MTFLYRGLSWKWNQSVLKKNVCGQNWIIFFLFSLHQGYDVWKIYGMFTKIWLITFYPTCTRPHPLGRVHQQECSARPTDRSAQGPWWCPGRRTRTRKGGCPQTVTWDEKRNNFRIDKDIQKWVWNVPPWQKSVLWPMMRWVYGDCGSDKGTFYASLRHILIRIFSPFSLPRCKSLLLLCWAPRQFTTLIWPPRNGTHQSYKHFYTHICFLTIIKWRHIYVL